MWVLSLFYIVYRIVEEEFGTSGKFVFWLALFVILSLMGVH